MDVSDQIDLSRSTFAQVLQYLEDLSSLLAVELDVLVAGQVDGLGKA